MAKEKQHDKEGEETSKRSTLPPKNKKRTSFNIDEELHRALQDYCFFEETDMVTYVFEHLVKSDLTAKGYYPPKERKRK
jgi:hypothetical protein